MIKKLFIIFLFTVTCLFQGCVKDLHDSGISDATLLKGRILEESEREPIANVRVIVTNGSTEYTSSKTNNEGLFEITVNYNNFDASNYLLLNAGSSGITKRIELKGMGQESYNYGDIFLYNKNDGATPTISTNAVKEITYNSAVCGGKITSDGGAEISQRGLCWGTTENPDISSSKVLCGSGLGIFTGNMTDLLPNTKYYVRAFATNTIGTAYGEQREFTTSNKGGTTKPTVLTNSVSNITSTSAECGGNVTSDGGATVTERGICWAEATITNRPTLSNNSSKTNEGGTGSFACNITGLTKNTIYYVRAYAKNSVGISYGDSVQFSTLIGNERSIPTVSTGECSDITSSSAKCRGDIASDGGANIIYSGICWSTSPNPTYSNNAPYGEGYVYAGNGGIGTFYGELTGLSRNTVYYYRAFAGNIVGVGYGDVRRFMTHENALSMPDVYTYTISYNSSSRTATGTGFIISDGDTPITGCGFCWGTSSDVEIENNPNVSYSSGPNSSGIFTSTISNLAPGTTYYIRAFATNAYGTGYGLPKQLVIPNQ